MEIENKAQSEISWDDFVLTDNTNLKVGYM